MMEENENYAIDSSEQDEKGISFGDIFYYIKKNIIAIVIFIVCFTACGFTVAKVKDSMSPRYTARATMFVTVNAENITPTQAYSYSSYISQTFVVFLTEDVVLDKAAEELNVTTYSIAKNISANLKNDSLIIEVKYTSKDVDESIKVANAVVNAAVSVSNETMESTDKDGNPTKVAKYPLLYGNISSLTMADENRVSRQSNTMKFTVIGLALGVVAAAIYVVCKLVFDKKYRKKEEIERELGIKVLASIPDYEIDESNVGGKN